MKKLSLNRITILFLISLTYSICVGQTKKENSYCDPYYLGHLCDNINPKQINFSKEYFDLQTRRYSKETNELKQSLMYDFSSILLTGENQQNGIIGQNYQRIQFHIEKMTKSRNPDTYVIKGKSKVNNNICDFKGELILLKLFYGKCDDPKYKKCAELFGSYVFYEDSSQNHSGFFKGIMECSIYLERKGKKMLLDESTEEADGYWNRTFVGTWTDYQTKKAKNCIWGDYRLPFTFDFDIGDGEMNVSEKYIMNGWKNYNDGSEYIEVAKDKWELKNKWWKKK